MPADRYMLLVEDNPDEEALTLHALREGGMADQVIVAHDGFEALEKLQLEHGQREAAVAPPPAVMVLDLKLPRIDGFELIRRVRADEYTCLLPLVVFSALRKPDDIVEAYRLGINSYVVKPVELDRFVAAVGLIGRYWLRLNQTGRGLRAA